MKPQLTVFQWSLLSGKLLCNFWAFLFSNKGRCRLDYTEEMHVKNQSLLLSHPISPPKMADITIRLPKPHSSGVR